MSIRTFFTAGIIGALALVALMCIGCRCGSTYVDGTRFRMGIYVPFDGQLYGLQVVEYLNGAAFVAPSNMAVTVTRTYAATNEYLGVIGTIDSSKTSVKAE